jgi:hypothetical protein
METPCFDEVMRASLDDHYDFDLVVHRNVEGGVAYAHTPMDATRMLVCDICYSGARVVMKPNDR